MKLTVGMFQLGASQQKPAMGLRITQMRAMKGLIGNAGWFNHKGERLGMGDLNTGDMNRIKAELDEGEIFVVLDEHASNWNFGYNKERTKGVDPNTPGPDYMVKHAHFAITKSLVYKVEDHYGNDPSFIRITRKEFQQLMLVANCKEDK